MLKQHNPSVHIFQTCGVKSACQIPAVETYLTKLDHCLASILTPTIVFLSPYFHNRCFLPTLRFNGCMTQCSVTAYRDDKSPNTRGVSGGGISTSSGDGTRGAGESATEEFIVAVKYVRREIRSLTDRDREVFLNAMAVMQRVPSAVGRAIYGRNYYSKDYFNRMHLYYGARTTKVSRAGPLISKAVEINALLLCVAPPVGYRYGTDRGDIVASMYGAYNTTGFRDYTSLCGEIRYFAEKHVMVRGVYMRLSQPSHKPRHYATCIGSSDDRR